MTTLKAKAAWVPRKPRGGVRAAPAIDLTTPHIEVAPAVRVGSGKAQHDARTTDLPVNTCLLPWPDFLLAAMLRFKPIAAGMIIGSLVLVGVLLLLRPVLPDNLEPGLLFSAPFLLVMVAARFIDSGTTRRVVVIMRDEQRGIYIDEQRWWKDEAAAWPDGYKWDQDRARVLWLDAQEPQCVRPFWPWGYPLPRDTKEGDKVQKAITTARAAGINTTRREVYKLNSWRESDVAERITQLFFGLIIGGSLIALWIGADRAIALFGPQPPAP